MDEPNNEVKRAWKQFSDGWGKRGDSWKNFRGTHRAFVLKRCENDVSLSQDPGASESRNGTT